MFYKIIAFFEQIIVDTSNSIGLPISPSYNPRTSQVGKMPPTATVGKLCLQTPHFLYSILTQLLPTLVLIGILAICRNFVLERLSVDSATVNKLFALVR